MKLRNAVVAAVAGLLLAGGISAVSLSQPAAGGGTARRCSRRAARAAMSRRSHARPAASSCGACPTAQIVDSLTNGIMKPMADGLSPAQIAGLAAYLTGRSAPPQAGLSRAPAAPAAPDVKPDAAAAAVLGKVRPVSSAMLKAPAPGDWLHWGGDLRRAELQPARRASTART